MLGVEHRQHRSLNNRAENSHQPTRRCERIMKRSQSAGQARRFLSVHDQVANLFRRPANRHPTDGFARLAVEIGSLKVGWRRFARAKFAALVELAISDKAACSIELVGCHAFPGEHPRAVRVGHVHDLAAITIPVALRNGRGFFTFSILPCPTRKSVSRVLHHGCLANPKRRIAENLNKIRKDR